MGAGFRGDEPQGYPGCGCCRSGQHISTFTVRKIWRVVALEQSAMEIRGDAEVLLSGP